jgi:hypothetical protein
MELNKAVKMHNFYPKGHPNLDSALNNCLTLLKKGINERDEIALTLDPKGFYAEKNPIAPGNEELSALAKKFFYRRIKELSFTQRLGPGDIKELLSILKIEPEELQAKGGAEALFAAKGVSGILLNEMRYEDLMKLKKELEEKEEEEEEPGIEEEEEEAAEGADEEAAAAEEAEEPEKPAREDEGLHVLLEKLARETDLLKYNDTSVRILERARALVLDNSFEEILPVLVTFHEHSTPTSSLHADLKAIALERLDAFLEHDGTLEYLVQRIGNKIEDQRAVLQRIVMRGGERAITILLNALIDAKEASRRRNIFNFAVLFGKEIIPLIQKELDSEKWYAVRQMVALLGELKDPSTIELLEYGYRNDDLRVKKEVLKSLARIQGPASSAFLLKALDEEDPSLMTQAVISLGMLRDPSVIESLGNIALKWEPFSDNQDPKREAIKALGIIGDPMARTYLTKVLFKKRWFGKRMYEEARILAANSLGMIGGEEAYQALEEVSRGSTGELYNACRRILDGREKST